MGHILAAGGLGFRRLVQGGGLGRGVWWVTVPASVLFSLGLSCVHRV